MKAVNENDFRELIEAKQFNGYTLVSGEDWQIPARELCRKHAISDATFYTWRKKYGGMEVPEVKRLKSLEEENTRLKKLLAEAMLDKEALQVALGRKY